MGIGEFVRVSMDWYRSEGVKGFIYMINQIWAAILRQLTPIFGEGTNIYEKDWDLLIVLDGCRVDAMNEVANEYSFLNKPDTHRSTASTSGEWMRTTFTPEYNEEIENTIYVTANQHSDKVENLPFLHFEDVYNYGWDSKREAYPADIVTDISIEKGREYADSYDRMIVHYMQPHFPSIPSPIGHGNKYDNVWKGLMIGQGDTDEIWEAYIDNLRYVLRYVKILLNNVDAENVVITADHGNAKGELWTFGHTLGNPVDCVKTVPWYTTSASDTKGRIPSISKDVDNTEESVDERLKALGYR